MPKTQAEINAIVDSYIGKWIDFDGYYALKIWSAYKTFLNCWKPLT
ncbi:hypothetical protein [Staphylococcus phage PT94]